ncbi:MULTISPECIES: hypothetical protein [Streptomyces]|uniref:Uncharacterized protein n=1 Tax=Streptomyces melanogenes TaxID=67326 RepID=A0ABZ1XRB0_9ACTN|nr:MULTISPECIES: hypothetical protein [Streptomyces]WHM36749.1 hypothetical protein QIY60_07515 [Streptomyces sp. BPTC-684]
MPLDPSDPEVFQEDDDAVELAQETPEADAAEQHTDVRQERDEPLSHVHPDAADEADAVEQTRVVSLDEDDYR